MKNLRKVLALVLALCVMLPVIGMSVETFAASDMTFTVSSVKKAEKGSKVTVTVKLKNSQAICAVNPYVVYDDSKLEFVSGENGDVFKKNAFRIGEAYKGKVRIIYYDGLTNIKKDGTMCKLTFKVLDEKDVKGYANVSLEFPENSVVNNKEVVPEFKTVGGSVEIKSPIVYAESASAENAISGAYYKKVPFFTSYKTQSIQLIGKYIGEEVKSVTWESNNSRLKVDENGLVTPGRPWHCRANITATITTKAGKSYKETFKIEFYRIEIQKKLPVI